MTQLLNNIKIGGGLDMDYVTPILKKCDPTCGELMPYPWRRLSSVVRRVSSVSTITARNN